MINYRALIIWIKTGTVWKRQMLPFIYISIQIYIAIACCIQLNDFHLQSFKTYMSFFKWLEVHYLSTNLCKFDIKMKNTSTSILWYGLICLMRNMAGKIGLLEVPMNFFSDFTFYLLSTVDYIKYLLFAVYCR